ncbi:hypothetical protein KDA08_05215 [Candidatus Saccharibacteria bacterium]|nr:hypothetical protein [Candidatus Saccharibacteria bacterium]
MSTQSQVSNIEIVSVDAYFGNQHLVCYDTVDASALAGKYIEFSSLTTDFYAWFDDGVAVDPAIVGKTAIAVPIVGTESAIAVAVLIETAINAVASVNLVHSKALSNQAKILIETKGQGEPLSAYTVGDSTFTATILRAGSKLALGYLDSDVELTLDEQTFDIVTHQTGTQVIGSLRTGTVVGPISLTLKETVAAKLKELLESSAAVEYTVAPSEKVTGIGSLAGSKQFTNTFNDAKMLVLHPTKNAANNYAEDFAFFLAYPKLGGLTFSGESDRKLTIECQIFLDELRVNEVNQMVVGLNEGGSWQSNLLKA